MCPPARVEASSNWAPCDRLHVTSCTCATPATAQVGDVAILMQAGFDKSAAIKAQLCTAIAAVLGTWVAIVTGKESAELL